MPERTTSTSLRSSATNKSYRPLPHRRGLRAPSIAPGRTVNHQPKLDAATVDGVDLLTDGRARERGWLVAFSSRRGGVSEPPFDSLNLAGRGGDHTDRVAQNRRRAAAAIGFPLGSLVLARQVHGTGRLHAHAGRSGVLGDADIITASESGPVLGILTADCAPVLLVGDRGIAVAHAGWRGLVAGVIESAVNAVAPVTAAWIGPCIHACCYQVGPEVIEAFRASGLPVAEGDRVDPADASLFALRRAGVEHVATADACTSCDPNYFSYRRDGVTGRQGAFLALVGPRWKE
jgi:polyphenol oxidase